MSVAEIGRRLEDRFALLAGRDRSAPDRHQTLEAVIAWSWNLLDAPRTRRALQTLSVFPDGFSLDGAEAVLGGDALAALAELVDQSLLVVREGEQVRYRLLETVREYGLKQLAATDGVAEARQRLWAWAVDTARALDREALRTGPGRDHGRGPRRGRQPHRGDARGHRGARRPTVVPLAGTLSGFWTIEGDHLGVHAISEPVLDLIVEQPPGPDERRRRGAGRARCPRRHGDHLHRLTTDGACRLLHDLGLAGDGSRTDILARLILEVYGDGAPSLEALDRLCADPDPALARVRLQWATQVRENSGDLVGAIEASSRALLLSDDGEGPWTRALLDSQVSGLATQAGDWDLAVEHASRALPVMRALGAAEDAVQLRSILAFADIAHGRLDEAARVIERDRLGRAHRHHDRLERHRHHRPGRARAGAR